MTAPHRFAPRKIWLLGALSFLLLMALFIQPAYADSTPTLQFSTFFGGSSSDIGLHMALDPNGNVYVVGVAGAADFPATDPFNVSMTVTPFYLTKFDPTGTTTLYSIFQRFGRRVAADADGAAYVVGGTQDGVITKINPAGTASVYSRTLAGSQTDYAVDVAVDSQKNVYVVGVTGSSNFPTLNAYQTFFGGGTWDVWVARFNAAGTLVYSTYFGGTGSDTSMDIAVDSAGNAYVTGATGSTDFPVLHPYQSACVPTVPSGGCTDAYVAKFSPSGALLYSSYIGGDGSHDRGNVIAVDALGSMYVTGETDSTDFPTSPSAFQSTLPGFAAAFVTRLSPDGSNLVFSTYLEGTTDHSQGFGIAPDGAGGAYVSGQTWETDFPTTADALRPVKTGPDHMNDAFLTRVSPDGQTLVYSTFFGGSGPEDSSFDDGPRIVLDPRGSLYLFGTTGSNDLAVLNAIQPAPGGGTVTVSPDAFLAKFAVPPVSLPAQATARNYFTIDTPTLTWTPITGTTHYHVQVSKDKLFTGTPDFEDVTLGNELFMTTDPLGDGLYYWRVQAQKPNGDWGGWSPVESFIIYAN